MNFHYPCSHHRINGAIKIISRLRPCTSRANGLNAVATQQSKAAECANVTFTMEVGLHLDVSRTYESDGSDNGMTWTSQYVAMPSAFVAIPSFDNCRRGIRAGASQKKSNSQGHSSRKLASKF
ncbi:hypothetical protein ACLOJK_013359 [Asimina triloba]